MKISIVLAALTGLFETDMARASKTTQKRMKEIEKSAIASGKVIGAAFAATAGIIAAGVNSAIDRMDEIGKSAQKVGIGTEALSELAYAAKLADVEFAQLEGALIKLTKAQDAAAQGSAEQLNLFRALGVEFQNQDGTLRSVEQVFLDLSDAIARLPDGANKTAASLGLLGRSGAQLIPLMNGGAVGIREAGDELERFGGQVGPEAAKMAEEFNDNLTRLKVASDGLFQSLAMQLLPEMVRFTEQAIEAAKEGEGLAEAADNAATFVKALGFSAQLAIDGVQGLTAGTISLYNAVSGLSKLTPPGWLMNKLVGGDSASTDFTEAGIAYDMARGAGQETRDNWAGTPKGVSPFSGSRGGRGAATRDPAMEALRGAEAEKALAQALEFSRGAADRAAAAKAATAAANRANALAAKESERREKEQAEALERAEEAQASFLASTEDLRAELGGPFAQAQLDYIRREDELIKLGELAGLSAEELAGSLELLEAARLKDVAAIQAQIDADKALAQALIDAPLIQAMDDFRFAFEDNVASVLDGTASIEDAIKNMVDDFIAQLARMAAQNFAASLFGPVGSTGGGGFGGFLSSLLGSFAGSGTGISSASSPFKGIPPGKALASGGGGGIPSKGGDTFIVQGSMSQRAHSRIVIDRARRQQRETARTG